MQEHLYRHFSSPGHKGFLNDVSVTLINKTDASDPKKQEDYWMKTLKNMVQILTIVSNHTHICYKCSCKSYCS